jgi:NADPH2:quinone reductase
MKAIRFHRIGGPEVLALEDAPEPSVGDGDVRIAVRAAGVNYADVHFRKGEYFVKPRFPDVPGLEAAGVVESVGSAVTLFRPGDRVMVMGPCAYAEQMVAPEARVYPMPDALSFEDAAALPVQGLTAMHVLEIARVTSGERVLVHAAAGGVGSLAVQLAKKRGARVIGTTTHAEKLDAIRALGADHAICTKDEDVTHAVRRLGGADVVLEMVGGTESYKRNLACLNPFGRMVVYGAASGELRGTIEPVGLMGKNLTVSGYYLTGVVGIRERCAPPMAELAGDVVAGRVRVVRGATLPLAEAAEAHRRLQAGASVGRSCSCREYLLPVPRAASFAAMTRGCALLLLLALSACKHEQKPSQTTSPSPSAPPASPTMPPPAHALGPGVEIAAQRMCDQIQARQRPVYVESLGDDVVWSDGAILERASVLPPSVNRLVAAPRHGPDAAIGTGAVVQLLLDMDRRRAVWVPAAVGPRKPNALGASCEVTAGATTALLDCMYVDYLSTRHPGGSFLVHGPLDPVLLMEGGKLHGVIMPMRP